MGWGGVIKKKQLISIKKVTHRIILVDFYDALREIGVDMGVDIGALFVREENFEKSIKDLKKK